MRNNISTLKELSKYSSGELEDALKNNSMYENFSNSSSMTKARVASGIAKSGAAATSHDLFGPLAALNSILNSSSINKENLQAQKDAHDRNSLNRLGSKDSMDNFSSIMSSGGSIKRLAGTASGIGAMTGLINPSLMASLISPGAFGASVLGGVGVLGSGAYGAATGTAAAGAGLFGMGGLSSALSATTLGTGALPIMAGIATMMAAGKGVGALSKYVGKGSVENKQLSTMQTRTRSTMPHELENQYGSTTLLQSRIHQMVNLQQITPAESMMANILSMIEGHTSVLPLLTANYMDSNSKKNKEGGNAAQNTLDEMFSSDGLITEANPYNSKRTFSQKIFNGLEIGLGNLSSSFNIFGQIANTLSGRSSTKLFNEANSKDRTDPHKAENQFASKFGLGVSLVRAIHTTPAQVMSNVQTYEGKHLALLGLMSEISRFSAHELLKIRVDGFGLKSSETHGFLAALKEQNELDNLQNQGLYDYIPGVKQLDELLGLIPGWNVISGNLKSLSAGERWMKDFFGGDLKNDGSEDREEKRSFKEVLSELFTGKDVKNSVLGNEGELRQKVGAVELTSAELMNNYLGKAYPDRFELLLEYNLSQMESLEAMAGPIKRSKNEKLSMNKYTGVFGNDKYHNKKNKEIAKKLKEEAKKLNSDDSLSDKLFLGLATKSLRGLQHKEALESNPFYKDFIESSKKVDSELDTGFKSKRKKRKNNTSVQDIQDAYAVKEREKLSFDIQLKQLQTLIEIRDCMDCRSNGYYSSNTRRLKDISGKDKDDKGLGFKMPAILPGSSGRPRLNSRDSNRTSNRTARTRFSNTMRSFANFFSLNTLRRLTSGGFNAIKAGGLRLISLVPAIAPLLLSPWFFVPLASVAAGYSIKHLVNKYLNNNDDRVKDNQLKGISSTDVKLADRRGKEFMNMISSYEKNPEKFAKKYLSKVPKIQLLQMLSDIEKGWWDTDQEELFKAALIWEISRRDTGKGEVTYIGKDAFKSRFIDFGSTTSDALNIVGGGSKTDNNLFTKEGLTRLKKFKSSELVKMYTAESPDFNNKMQSQFSDILNLAVEREISPSTHNAPTQQGSNSFIKVDKNKLGTTSAYGNRDSFMLSNGSMHAGGHHAGMDFSTKGKKTPVYSLTDGTAFLQNDKDKGGLIVYVLDPVSGKRFYYMHLSRQMVENNTKVKKGDLIGYAGNTGSGSGVHVHIGVKDNVSGKSKNYWHNPEPFIKEAMSLDNNSYAAGELISNSPESITDSNSSSLDMLLPPDNIKQDNLDIKHDKLVYQKPIVATTPNQQIVNRQDINSTETQSLLESLNKTNMLQVKYSARILEALNNLDSQKISSVITITDDISGPIKQGIY